MHDSDIKRRVNRILLATTKARLLNVIPADRCRLDPSVTALPKAGDIVLLDQGFTGPDGKPMGLVHGVDENGQHRFEAEAYDSELELLPDDPDDAAFLAKHFNTGE
jgi:hypothetical protein